MGGEESPGVRGGCSFCNSMQNTNASAPSTSTLVPPRTTHLPASPPLPPPFPVLSTWCVMRWPVCWPARICPAHPPFPPRHAPQGV